MKEITILTIAVLVGSFIFFAYEQRKNESDDLYYREQIQSLDAQIKRLKSELDTVKANTDTLKIGQRVIYDEVRKNANKSFFDFFK